jgi:hypothetical protein
MLISWRTDYQLFQKGTGVVEQALVVVAYQTHSGGTPFDSQQEFLTDVFCGLTHSLQEDARIVRQLCHDGFLTHPF